jgi:hypothetical protein
MPSWRLADRRHEECLALDPHAPQALAMIETGAALAFDLGDAEIALACRDSPNSQPPDVQEVRASPRLTPMAKISVSRPASAVRSITRP